MRGDGVDDDMWTYNLLNGEYSQWFRQNLKDPDLAAAAERVERDVMLDAAASRTLIRQEIERRYTLPADEPSGIVDPAPSPEHAAALAPG